MKKTFTKLFAALALLAFFIPSMIAVGQTRETKTEGFETATAGSTYNSTQTYTAQNSDCGIGWTMYYGTVSTNAKITGNKSAQMRWYSTATSNLPYICSTTPVSGLTKIGFNAKVGNTNVKMNVQYSSDGSSWTTISGASAVTFSNTTSTAFEYNIPSGGQYIKIAVSSSSTAPSNGNYNFVVDDVVFTYSSSTPTTYTVTYDCNGGESGCPDPSTISNISSGTSITLANAPSKTGYDFIGWSDGGTTYATGNSYTVNSDVTFTAQWQEQGLLVFDFTSNPNNWPTTNPTSLTNYIYPLGGANYTFALLNVKSNSGYLMLTSTAVLGLPARSGYKLTKVVAHNSSQCSTTTVVGISSSASEASYITGGAAQTWSTTSSSYTYTLTSTEENTMYYLYVTNKNAQLIQLDLKYEETAPNPAVATTTTIDYSGITNTDVHTSTTAGSLSATVTAGGSAVLGATITWSGDNDDVATIDASTGAVTLVAAGTVTFTASYLGVSGTYLASSDTYELTVTDSTPVTGTDVTFVAGTDTGETSVTKDGITVSMSTMSRTDNYRCYANSDMTVTSVAGKTITKVVLTCVSGNGANNLSIPTGSSGSYSYSQDNLTGTWTGSTNTVTLRASTQVRITQIVVTYETDNTPTISATPSTLDTFISLSSSTDSSAAQSVSVSGANLTSDITVSVGNNSAFEISTTENGTYTNTITLTQSSGIVAATNVYVRMKANQTGNPTGTLTLSSTGATSVTIALNGSVVTPMTVAQAITAIDAATGNTVDNAYVSGIVCQIDSYNSSYHSITYWISDDGTTTTKLEVYSGKGLNGDNFTSVDNLTVGDEVVVFGNLKLYNNTYEFNYDNYLVSFEHNIIPIINANNVSIAYNEESGSIEYSITNGTGLVSAVVTDGNWLKLGTITNNAVPFTCSTNTGNERTASITLSFTGATNKVVTITQGAYVAPPVTATYKLATSIVSGKQYIIVGENNGSYYAMGHDKGNNRHAVEISVNGTIATASIAATQTDAHEFTITSLGEGYYSIQDATAAGYLYAAASGSNYLKTENSLDEDGKGDWAITFAVEGYVGVVAKNTDVRNDMRFNYNNGAPLFSCYDPESTTGTSVYLYEKVYTIDIEGHGGNPGKYYLITSPLNSATSATNVENLFDTNLPDFDLYKFNQSAEKEWVNWKNNGNLDGFNLVAGTGYLYANKNDVTLVFDGTPYSGTGVFDLTYDAQAPNYAGWNLVGNPYTTTATIDKAAFYRMNEQGTDVTIVNGSGPIAPMEGIFVLATTTGQSVKFTQGGAKRAENAQVSLNIVNNRGNVIDRAIVSFDENGNMPKFMIDGTNTKIYIPQNDGDYAIVSSNGQGTMPVNFKAKEMGMYTISVETEGIDLSYLHLIDRLTGEDVNLLIDSKYSFIASSSDMESRFILSFNENGINANGNETFAFQNGNDIIVNGEGELQVFDVMGRIVSNVIVNGVEAIALPQGVYIFRLNENIQKIVVR